MAKTNKTPPSSSLRENNYNKSHPFILFLSFLFIFLLLARPADQIRHSNMVSEPDNQTLPASTASTSSSSSTATTTTSTLRPNNKAHHEKSLPSKQFEASEHEVPSGPNPISNR
uniref:Uncharacterized protein n=1 Tax=Chenopodium quinoa TaxID=63459 RepID=A0A803LAH9_CHEQI